MNMQDPSPAPTDPLQMLGLSVEATQEEIRARYLELIKRFPPEHEPERFQEIQLAFQAAKDPLVLARTLLKRPSDTLPDWAEVIEKEKSNPPPLGVDLLLSLGNRQQPREEITETSNKPR
jgi:hypothetical protein